MSDSLASVTLLRRRIDRLAPARPPCADRLGTGCAALDARLAGGGLAHGALHELIAPDRADATVARGLAAMLAARTAGPLVWLHVAAARRPGLGGALYPPGLREIGVDPARLLLVGAPDPPALLHAAGDVLRCPEVALAVIELWGPVRLLDLTASRRLALAAEGSGVLGLLLRVGVGPAPSAAATRWVVRAAASTPLPAHAPGLPALDLQLVRQRGGPAGVAWRVEWDRDRNVLCEPAPSGAVASLPERRPAGSATPAVRGLARAA